MAADNPAMVVDKDEEDGVMVVEVDKGSATVIVKMEKENGAMTENGVAKENGETEKGSLGMGTPSGQKVNVRFSDLTYSVPVCRRKAESRTLLRGISGECRTGELSAIMGPSGAGKSTLMNVLAAYKTRGLTKGQVLVNGEPRDVRSFRKLSCYIMQDDHLLPQLSVEEAMMAAAALKLPAKVGRAGRRARVAEVLTALSLSDDRATRSSKLSGGQRKRLSIALELLNNPPVMFFDEPTSGLDSLSCFQCMSLLKRLAAEGRTIVCTVHQPSAKLFELFDKLYVVSGGWCVYAGRVRSLVPFLSSQGLNCPPYHNPADYVIEVASGEYGDLTKRLADLVTEGLCDRLDSVPDKLRHRDDEDEDLVASRPSGHTRSHSDASRDTQLSQTPLVPLGQHAGLPLKGSGLLRSRSVDSDFGSFPTTSGRQLGVLFVRTFLTILRDTNLTALRLASHTTVGLLIGLLYRDVGNEATKMVSNAACHFFSMMFLMFTALMPTVMTFPLERKVLFKEHHNYWYSLKAYYLAKTLADTPFQILFPCVYGTMVYWMTGQPGEAGRLAVYLTFCVGMGLTAQACGLLIGATFSLQLAVFLGPITAIPIMLFSGFFVQFSDIPPYLAWLTYASYVRFGFQGLMLALFSLDRPALDCQPPNSTLCIYRDPQTVLETLDMDQGVWWHHLLALIAYFLLFRIAAYLVLKFKLRSRR